MRTLGFDPKSVQPKQAIDLIRHLQQIVAQNSEVLLRDAEIISKNDKIQAKVVELQAKVTELDSRITEQEARVRERDAEVESLRKDNAALRSALNASKRGAKLLAERVDALEEEMKTLKAQLTDTPITVRSL
ncbi:hypothetical protein CPC08DRAFT_769716 [Agrocybe pediades]|nr:hypothetical protein CPC08DRAFT_769716 [Agrocybe pediades]